jgi:hypothetical protein
MLLDDPLEHGGVARPIPDTFGIDHGHRTTSADAEAIGLGTRDATLIGEPQGEQTCLQVVPGDDRPLAVAALRLGLVATQEDMAPRRRDADGLGLALLSIEDVGRQGRAQRGRRHQYRTAPVTRTQ